MKFSIVTVGRVKVGFYRDGIAEYEKRLRRFAEVQITPVKEATQATEGERLLAKATGYVVALDERGTRFTTEQLAQHISALELRGEARLSVLIGGADGHSEAVRKRADELWSLSPLTLPHDLALLVLLEQLYRVETLRAGHPYHRGN